MFDIRCNKRGGGTPPGSVLIIVIKEGGGGVPEGLSYLWKLGKLQL